MAHILLIEDDPIGAEVATVICQGAGHTVVWARDGLEGLGCLAVEMFDLALVDIQMPVMDGLTFTRQVRAHPALRALPILALTAKAGHADQCAMRAVGMSSVLTKPYRNATLRQAIMDLLNGPCEAPVPVADVSTF